jgi:hypothetical protein
MQSFPPALIRINDHYTFSLPKQTPIYAKCTSGNLGKQHLPRVLEGQGVFKVPPNYYFKVGDFIMIDTSKQQTATTMTIDRIQVPDIPDFKALSDLKTAMGNYEQIK